MTEDLIRAIEPKLKDIAEKVRLDLATELEQQGHRLSGKLEKSISYEILQEANAFVIAFDYLKYGIYVNNGVSPQNIPFSGRTGRGGTSKYIQALIDYAQARGMNKPVSAAFAIAHKHKREGMPTKASRRFSANGRRTGFQNQVIEDVQKELPNLIDKHLFNQLRIVFENLITEV
jgi:hypothetical protein